MQKLQQNIEEKKQNKKKKMKKEENITLAKLVEADIIPQDDVEMKSVEVVVSIPVAAENPIAEENVPDEYTILGTDKHEKRKSVKTILPAWLAYPTIVSNNLTETGQAISELDFIDEQIKKNLAKMKVENLFPVQKEVIPWLLDVHSKPSPYWPRDVCVSAPTGSGKTLSFAVPIVQLLLKRVERKIRALIILPVQELADQVAQVVKQLTVNTKLKAHLLSSSFSFAAEQAQIIDVVNGKYLSNVDILITTAGRLVEHLNKTKGFSLKSLQFLVIDEADRVMDQIQNDWLYHLNKHVKSESDTFLVGRPIALCPHDLWNTPRPPHKLLFSATLSSDPEKLQSFNLFHPKLFTTVVVQPNALSNYSSLTMEEDGEKRGSFVGKYTTPAELTEKYIITEQHVKPLSLFTIIKENKWRKFLCFTNQADTAHRLAFVLQKLMGDEMKIEELSSALTISARKSVLQKFSLGEVNG
jgi:ATP-dependent RNA helicase DDX51/DBP6